MLIFLRIMAFVLVILGAAIVFMARKIEKKYELAKKEVIRFEKEYDEKTIELLKKQKAIIRVKLFGTLFFIPGMIMILILY